MLVVVSHQTKKYSLDWHINSCFSYLPAWRMNAVSHRWCPAESLSVMAWRALFSKVAYRECQSYSWSSNRLPTYNKRVWTKKACAFCPPPTCLCPPPILSYPPPHLIFYFALQKRKWIIMMWSFSFPSKPPPHLTPSPECIRPLIFLSDISYSITNSPPTRSLTGLIVFMEELWKKRKRSSLMFRHKWSSVLISLMKLD